MYRSHESFIISWFRTIINGFIYIGKGIVILCTVGWITPQWDYDYLFHCAKKDLKEKDLKDKIERIDNE